MQTQEAMSYGMQEEDAKVEDLYMIANRLK